MDQKLDRLTNLAPALQEPARVFITKVEKELGVKLFVVHTWRSLVTQLQIYSEGREFVRGEGIWKVVDTKVVKTDAYPGTSAHNVVTVKGAAPAAVALDVIPIVAGKLAWKTDMGTWQRIWTIAWKVGFDPLGDKTGSYLEGDLGHFEEPAWRLKLGGLGLRLPSLDEVHQLVVGKEV